MLTLLRTDSSNPDFVRLVRALDAYLTVVDGDAHAFYDQYNAIAVLDHIIVAYENGAAVGCGAIKTYEPGTMEIKRMYTAPESRGRGVAQRILAELEQWTRELGCSRCILETGMRQTEAVALYTRCAYRQIPNYGQYAGVANSVCFEKLLGD